MVHVTPQNLTTANINWHLLPKNLQGEKKNLDLYSEFYNEDEAIKKQVDELIKVINTTHRVKEPKKNPAKQGRGKVAPAKKRVKATAKRQPVKTKTRAKKAHAKATPAKKARVKATPSKRVKAAKRKAVTPRKVAAKRKAVVPPKAPVTVKKLSAELQLIKSFTLMKGKDKKVSVLKSYLKRVGAAIPNCNVPTQKSILSEIKSRLNKGLSSIDKSVTVIQKMGIDDAFVGKCKAALKNAKPRMQVQYLSGLSEDTVKK